MCRRGLCEGSELHWTNVSSRTIGVRWGCHQTQREDAGAGDGATSGEVRANRGRRAVVIHQHPFRYVSW
jgi:hypothetical protein